MEQDKNKAKKSNPSDEELKKPDPETLGTTDPQEEMEGPVSSLVHKSGKIMESKISKEEADKRHKDNL
ncbi:hypothetical protein GCM10027051_20030 [Niabella terrae]